MTSNDSAPSTSGQDSTKDTGLEELAFEDAFRQLAEIAEILEAGGLTLSEATSRYEHGMKLVRHCNLLLDSAELEVTTLREGYQRPAAPGPAVDTSEPPYFDAGQFDEIVEEEDDLPF